MRTILLRLGFSKIVKEFDFWIVAVTFKVASVFISSLT